MLINLSPAILWIVLAPTLAGAEDWPMWRYDAGHTAASPERLPEQLQLQWVREYSPRVQVWDDPLNNDLMAYDKVFEPVVADGRMFVGFNDSDKVVALDVETGRELWSFFTDGPVRLPPAAWRDKVYFVSDDGYLYCLRAADGALHWKQRGAPSAGKVLGNKRLISSWPARGGPVIRDGLVYFAASIWPFMGTFLYALDAETGRVEWVNDGGGSQYISQPHGAPAFAGVAPQGVLVAAENALLVPGGRSLPAAFDRQTGKSLYFHHGGKRDGGAFVVANQSEIFIHTRRRGVRAWNLKNGARTEFTLNEPVLDGELIYTAFEKDGSHEIQVYGPEKKELWSVGVDARSDLIKAGDRLYAASETTLSAVDPPICDENEDQDEEQIVWSYRVEGGVRRLLAANGKLFAVTLDGRILAFGDGDRVAVTIANGAAKLPKAVPESIASVRALRADADVGEGYALWYGIDDLQLLDAVLSETELRVIAVDQDADKINRLRHRYDSMGLYGRRVTCHVGEPKTFAAPPYIAHLVTVGSSLLPQIGNAKFVASLYRSVRPYGGTLWFPSAAGEAGESVAKRLAKQGLSQAETVIESHGVCIYRHGALPGSADWTHQYGNVANTVKSDDRRVKLPLGLLWFGGNSNLDVLPRHSHGPTEQVVGGRLFIEGMDCISARDVYTGRVLWKTRFPNLGTFGAYYNHSYEDQPLNPIRNQSHMAGANVRGTNFIATSKSVYVVQQSRCHVLDARTGQEQHVIEMPKRPGENNAPSWAYIGITEDILLGGWDFAALDKPGGAAKRQRLSLVDMSSSKGLVAFHRQTGKVLWTTTARTSFLHNGIVAGNGRVYCLDRLPQAAENSRKRRGQQRPEDYRIVALDVRTGQQLWQQESAIFGTWLGYSAPRDLLLLAGAKGVDRLEDDEVGQGMSTYQGRDGKPIWSHQLKYAGPCILHHDTIITNVIRDSISSGAFNLLDGSPRFITNPLTGREEPWRIARTYGCDSMTACENFLTFRSGAAGYYDLLNPSGTGNIGGFKSSCSGNLIAANGVLNAPDYTRTCSCSYQNQTSLALIYDPTMETWANSELGAGAEPGTRVQRIGLNLGAPGDRRDENGTLWIDVPSVGGSSPDISVVIGVDGNDDLEYFRRHAAVVRGSGPSWIAASGVKNVRSLQARLQTIRYPFADGGHPIQYGQDDAEQFAEGRVALSQTELELGEGTGAQLVGLRFRNLPLDAGTPIDRAIVQFEVDERSLRPTKLTLHAQAADDAAEFRAVPFDISSRQTTVQSILWEVEEWTKSGHARPAQQTPDLTELVREVITRPGWQRGNALVFLIRGAGQRVVESLEGNPSGAARLIITQEGKTISARAEPLPDLPQRPHTVRLHFCEPDDVVAGARVFDVTLQGTKVLANYDIVQEAGGRNRGTVEEFLHVPVGSVLELGLQPASDDQLGPVLSGVEIIAEPVESSLRNDL